MRTKMPVVEGAEESAPLRTRITRDALWLFSGYAVTAGTGFAFWVLAAVWIPQAELGVDAAVLAAVMAAAAFASNGPGSALVVMLPLGGEAARETLRRAYLVVTGLAIVLGAVAGILVSRLLLTDASAPLVVAGVTGATVVWALFNVQALALAGAGDARSTLFVNGGANLAKLALLPVVAFGMPWLAQPLVVATLAPAIVGVVIAMTVLVPRALRRESLRPGALTREWDAGLASDFRIFTAQNALAVGLVLGVGLSLPFLVTVLSSPSQGAVFALAFQFGSALDLLGVGVATALARSAATDYETGAALARPYAWRIAVLVAGLGVAATVAAPLLFLALGRGYQPLQGMAVVGVLALASTLRPGYDLWSALLRARRRALPVLTSNALYTTIVIALVVLLVPVAGSLGASVAVAAGATALAIIGAAALRRTSPRTFAPIEEAIA